MLESFRQWCEATRVDFQLDEAIQAQLAQRRFKIGQTRPYGEWRRLHQGSPATFEAVGYKDDPSKRDEDVLFVGWILVHQNSTMAGTPFPISPGTDTGLLLQVV